MKKLFMLAAAAVVFGSAVVGCSNTAEGAKTDATKDTVAVEKGAADAGAAVKNTADAAVTGTEKAAADAAAAAKKTADTAVTNTEKGIATAGATVKNAADTAVTTTEKTAADVAAGTKKAADDAGQVVKHTGKVLTITPKVKSALLRDNTLYPSDNTTLNKIDVDTTSDGQTIRLSGTVKSNDMKTKAGEIAKNTLKGESTPYKIDNELKVSP